MKMIAREAGVTVTTVSRILNRKGFPYAAETEERIFAIAERLRYRPNALVLGMQTGRTGLAGVMIPTSTPFYAGLVTGLHHTLLDNETVMLLTWNARTSNHDREDDTWERQIIHKLVDRRVDGIILRPSCEEFQSSYFEEIWERDIPLILVDREMSFVKTDFVGTDDQTGGKQAAEFLYSLGHRRLLFAGESELVSTSRHRKEGFIAAVAGMPDAYCRVLDLGRPEAPAELAEILRSPDRPTGVFAYNDAVGESIVMLAKEAGLEVPRDLSVVGFGNEPSPSAPIALTTFDQQPMVIGDAAAKLYLERTTNRTGPKKVRRILIEAKLVERQSTSQFLLGSQ